MNYQLDYRIISKISDITSEIAKIFKSQWKTDRKAYNKIKHIKEEIMRSRERVTYFVISGNEVKPERGIEILNKFKEYADVMIPYVVQDYRLKELKDEADSIITLIKLAEHEPSSWNQLK